RPSPGDPPPPPAVTETAAEDARVNRAERLAAYLRQAQGGDTAALDPVIRELNPLLWHVARAQGLSTEDAIDVVQTTWLELLQRLREIRSPQALTMWLISTTRRGAWRAASRRRREGASATDELLGEGPASPPGGERVERQVGGAGRSHRRQMSYSERSLIPRPISTTASMPTLATGPCGAICSDSPSAAANCSGSSLWSTAPTMTMSPRPWGCRAAASDLRAAAV